MRSRELHLWLAKLYSDASETRSLSDCHYDTLVIEHLVHVCEKLNRLAHERNALHADSAEARDKLQRYENLATLVRETTPKIIAARAAFNERLEATRAGYAKAQEQANPQPEGTP